MKLNIDSTWLREMAEKEDGQILSLGGWYKKALQMSVIELGIALYDLAEDQSEWSQKTFGTDAERGPIGGLKHLAKEALEAVAAPDDITEYADCLILLLDASRRAGFTPYQLIRAAQEKMKVNKTRVYLKPTSDEPSEHIK